MAKKSKMALAGKAAKKAFNERCRLAEEQQKRMRDAKSSPLRLREVIPPCIKGIKSEHLDDEMATIAELTGEEKSSNYEPRLGIAIDPIGFGEETLRWFKNFWQKELSKVGDQTTQSETTPADNGQLFEAQIQKTRLQAVISYLDQLISLCDGRTGMPVLPQCRSRNYFCIGCLVVVFIPARSDFLPHYHHQFVSGNITAVANGKVTVQLNQEIRVYHDRTDRCQLTYHADSMRIVRFEDFDGVLLHDHYYRGGWLNLSAAYEGDPELATNMKNACELEQIDQKVGDYEFVAKIRSERK